ncbi:MAG: type I-B CRISPR-associated endonuclease Cas1b [Candidatus Aminicenantaceae bacterium]
MKSYYITTCGKLKREGNTLKLEMEKGNKHIPIETVESLNILSDVDINVDLLEFLSKHGIVTNFFGFYGNYVGSFWPKEKNLSGDLLVRQVKAYLNGRDRIMLSKEIVRSSILNLSKGFDFEDSLETAETIQDLMLLEARCRKKYYQDLEKKLSTYGMKGRSRRPPQDPVNALLSFGYSLLYATVNTELYKTSLDPRVSYLHEPFQSRFSLSLDLADIFKPITVDRMVSRLLKEGVLNKDSFELDDGVYLKKEKRRKFLEEYSKTMQNTIYHKKLKRKVSYSYLIRLDAYKIMRYLLEGEKPSFFSYSRRW